MVLACGQLQISGDMKKVGHTTTPLQPSLPGLLFVQALNTNADPDNFPTTWTNVLAR